MRCGLECCAPPEPARWSESITVTAKDLAHELHELIAALDRRVPRVEQAGEDAIARDAAVSAGGNAGKISTANTEITKGDNDAAANKPDSAIGHYKNAWSNAVAAYAYPYP